MKESTAIRYSEAFKRQVVDGIARGKFISPHSFGRMTTEQLRAGLRSAVTLPSHVNKMNHDVGSGRIPFWKSCLSWKTGGSGVIHLLWGSRICWTRAFREIK